MTSTDDIKGMLEVRYASNQFRGDTVEIQGAKFFADKDYIFPGTRNLEYIKAEIEWYETKDRRVERLFEIYGKEVKIWKDVADANGLVWSNYGYCIYSDDRGSQFRAVVEQLKRDPLTRQACMYYTVPEMHHIAGKDHTCTAFVQYFLDFPKDTFGPPFLDAHVYMRSNDAVFGYNNDVAWQDHVLKKLADAVDAYPGKIFWNAGSFHVYKRHFHLLEA